MKLFLFLIVIWFLGLVITVLHELAHVVASRGKLEFIQIGIAHRFGIQINRVRIYPLFPIAGFSKITLTDPSRLNVLTFTLAGCVVGLLASILCVVFGLYLLPSQALTEIQTTHHLGFLIRQVLHNEAGCIQTVGTALIASGVLYGVQQLGNLLPVCGFDGYHAWQWIFKRR
jgi:Zn-dependent protease